MTAIAGASRYINSATLANEQGVSPSIPTLTGGGSTQSILEAARAAGHVKGIGLSSSARALNSQFLDQTGSQGVGLFGLSSGASLSVADMAKQIKALRSSLPKDKISDEVIAAEEAKAEEDAKAAAESLQKEAENLVKNHRGVSQDEYQKLLEEQIRILERKQADANAPTHTSFRRGLTLDEQA
ncbi:MAG: hypothetical protein LRY54_00765 [Alphaproteobacteria bacterium]|nr:hypothetical protein [Alphaproteobacteria bacterium]